MCECGAKIKMKTIESDVKWQNRHVRQWWRWKAIAMDDAIQYLHTLNVSFQFHIGTLTFYKKMQNSHVPRWSQNKDGNEWAKHNINLSCQTKRRKTIMTDVANQFMCFQLLFWRHIHTLTFLFLAKSLANKNDISHTHKQLQRDFFSSRFTLSFAFRNQFYMFDHNL